MSDRLSLEELQELEKLLRGPAILTCSRASCKKSGIPPRSLRSRRNNGWEVLGAADNFSCVFGPL